MVMKMVPIVDAKAHLSEYIRMVETGETVFLCRRGRPVAEIRRVPPRSTKPRPFGLCKGEFVVPEDFNDPLPEDILRLFEGR